MTVRVTQANEKTTPGRLAEMLNRLSRDVRDVERRVSSLEPRVDQARDAANAAAQIIAKGYVTTDGAGAATLEHGTGATASIDGNDVRLTLSTARQSNDYYVLVTDAADDPGFIYSVARDAQTSQHFEVEAQNTAGSTQSAAVTTWAFFFIVFSEVGS